MRFRCILNNDHTLKYHPYKAGMIINACCVLHNMCIRGNIPLHIEFINNDEDIEAPNDNYIAVGILNEGRNQRANIINQYFQDNL